MCKKFYSGHELEFVGNITSPKAGRALSHREKIEKALAKAYSSFGKEKTKGKSLFNIGEDALTKFTFAVVFFGEMAGDGEEGEGGKGKVEGDC